MKRKNDNTTKNDTYKSKSAQGNDFFGSSTTSELSREPIIDRIPIDTRSYLKIVGFDKSDIIIYLDRQDVIIGRGPECGIHLPVSTVSRTHARVFFRNEEYCLEDLGSANGTYVNGIKVVRCMLRNNDQIDIGEMKMLFHEDQVLDENEKPS
jgi:hypothetical protein